ncbi:hypothetical protein C496_23216 [Natronorubrum tibetense GA33]|uniref:HVO-2833 C-terminal domain-containing protein n=1 Tax=Natronorubrum tibetense GA33 TaxID=1114856 RepID=L9VGU6_9EURY|nr:hypothetical protein C496_23216 [Natronorubrum tibetense GA33]
MLTGKALEFLFYLDQSRVVADAAERSGNYRNTLNSKGLEEVSPTELCCHTLLIDDIRHRSYCLLFLSHVGEGNLRKRAAKYGLKDEIDALFQCLEIQGEVEADRLSEWLKFQELETDLETYFY